jgi:hypothetical protein
MRWYKFDRKTKKISKFKDIANAVYWFENADRSIAKTHLMHGKILISTTFLSLDHSYGEGDPVLFETMAFGENIPEYQVRYTNYADAIKGHKEMVAKVKRHLKNQL